MNMAAVRNKKIVYGCKKLGETILSSPSIGRSHKFKTTKFHYIGLEQVTYFSFPKKH